MTTFTRDPALLAALAQLPAGQQTTLENALAKTFTEGYNRGYRAALYPVSEPTEPA